MHQYHKSTIQFYASNKSNLYAKIFLSINSNNIDLNLFISLWSLELLVSVSTWWYTSHDEKLKDSLSKPLKYSYLCNIQLEMISTVWVSQKQNWTHLGPERVPCSLLCLGTEALTTMQIWYCGTFKVENIVSVSIHIHEWISVYLPHVYFLHMVYIWKQSSQGFYLQETDKVQYIFCGLGTTVTHTWNVSVWNNRTERKICLSKLVNFKSQDGKFDIYIYLISVLERKVIP